MNMDIKYTYLPVDVQQQLQEIKRMIYLKMNGVTAEQMEKSGVCYSKNYGVSLPEIKQLSSRYTKNIALARALWNEKIRETMLLAIYLCPEADLDGNLVEKWVGDVVTLELAENISRNLLCRLSFVGAKSEEWTQSDNLWKCAVGFFCAAFGLDRFSQDQRQELLSQVKQCMFINEVPVYRAIALFLRKLGGENVATAKDILEFVTPFESSSHRAEGYIYEEVQTDLKYRFDL
jgi:3-methyladenine DNA glycosylase AlkD